MQSLSEEETRVPGTKVPEIPTRSSERSVTIGIRVD